MFSVIFPIDDKYVVFDTMEDAFNGTVGIGSQVSSFFEDKMGYMMSRLISERVPCGNIINNETLLFKYFSTFGSLNVSGETSLSNCVVNVKTLCPKIYLREIVKETERLGLIPNSARACVAQ